MYDLVRMKVGTEMNQTLVIVVPGQFPRNILLTYVCVYIHMCVYMYVYMSSYTCMSICISADTLYV